MPKIITKLSYSEVQKFKIKHSMFVDSPAKIEDCGEGDIIMRRELFSVCYRTMFAQLIFGLFVFCSLGISDADGARGVTDDTVKIGVLVDQTGPAASVGIPLGESTRIYFRNINDQGGINGRKIKVIVEDDHYSIPGAFSAFKKLIFRDKILSLLYCGGTGQTLALGKQINKNKVPVVPVSLAETMTTPVKQYIFTATSSYDDGIKILIDYMMKDLKAKKPRVAIVYPDLEFGKTGLRAVQEYLPNYELELSNKVILALGAIDATSEVLALRRSKPDYVILHNAAAAVISFLKSAKKFGLKSPVLGSFYVSEEAIIATSGNASKDMVAVSPFAYWAGSRPGMVELKRITKRYQPDTEPKTRSYTQGWITSMICAEGLRRAGKDLTPARHPEAFETFKDFSTGEISGPISYDKHDHKGGKDNRIYKTDIKQQTFIPITGFREPAIKD